MYKKLKRGAGLLVAAFILVSNLSGNVLAAVSEYTPGIREFRISLQDYVFFSDNDDFDTYETQNLVNSDEKTESASVGIDCEEKIKFSSANEYNYDGLESGKEYVGNTTKGKWLLYRNIDFGSNGIEYFNYKASKDGEHKGYMNIYLLNPGTDVSSGIPIDARRILSKPRNGNDNTGSWSNPLEFQVVLDDCEFVSGVFDVLITFTNTGLGTFYDFSFTKCKPIHISNAGEVQYKEYIPFNIEEIEIVYDTENELSLTVAVDDEKKEINLSADKNKLYLPFDNKIIKGEKNITVISDGTIELRSIILHKEKCSTSQSALYERYDEYPMINYTPIEEMLKTTIIFNNNSPIYITGNAKGYINYNDASEIPYISEDTAYVPLETMALATGAYFEEKEGFCLLRFANSEVLLKNGVQYRQINCGEYTETQKDIIKRNNRYYVPITKYLELSGRYVEERNGYIVADDELKVEKIFDDKNYSQLKELYKNLEYTQISGKTYYVSQSGNASDENDGSKTAPFNTISKAASVAVAGDTVIIDSGVYRETVKPKSNGTAGNPIIFRSAEGANVVISALDNIPSTFNSEDGLRVYDVEDILPQGRNMVFRNGGALAEGRYPNKDGGKTYDEVKKKLELSPLWPTSGNIIIKDGNAYCKDIADLPEDYFEGATLVSHNSKGWALSTAKVTGSENGNIYLGDKSTKWWWDEQGNENDYAYLTGFKNSIDVPGEWYADADNKKLYIMPIEDSDTYEVKARQLCIDLTDRTNIQIIDINTIGGGINMLNSKMCVINGGEHKYISHYTFSYDQHNGYIDDGNSLDINGAPRRGEMGIYLGGDSNVIINTNIKYSAASAIYNTGKYSLIYNNNIEETGYMGSYVGGIFIVPDAAGSTITDVRGGHRIYYNTIDKTGRAGLEVNATEHWYVDGLPPFASCDIAYNKISNGSILARDTGNIYTYGVIMGDDDNKTKIRNNLIMNQRCTDGDLCYGIYYDNWSQMIETYENVLLYTDYTANIEGTKKIQIQSPEVFPTAFSYINAWNNKQLENKRSLPLNDEEYPNNKRFRAGANALCENNNIDKSKYASVSENTATVYIGDNENALEIYYIANPYKSKEEINLSINGEKYVVEPDSIGQKEGYINSITLPVKFKGNAVINVENSNVCSVKAVNYRENVIYAKYYGGEFSGGDTDKAHTKTGPDGEHSMLNETWKTFRLKYSDVYISSTADTAVISYSTIAHNSGGTFQITIGDNLAQTSEIVSQKDDWFDFSPIYAKLSNTVQPGKYDVYVDFKMKSPQTCNFWWFGFAGEDDLISDAYKNVDLSNESIIENAEFTDEGIVLSEESKIDIKNLDFGENGFFRMVADYDILDDSKSELAVQIDDEPENILFHSEIYGGTQFGFPVNIQSKEAIGGVHDVTIKLSGSGKILLRSLAFEKSKMYITEFHIDDDVIKGKVHNAGGTVVVGIYTPSGLMKDCKICKNVGDCSDIEIGNRNEDYILKIFGFENLENLKPIDNSFVVTKQKESE